MIVLTCISLYICINAELAKAAEPIFVDNFNDNTIDSSIWQKDFIGTGTNIVEENQKLNISFAANSSGSLFLAAYHTNCKLQGDFDLQVDFELSKWPAANGVRVGLFANYPRDAVERISFGAGDVGADDGYLTDFGGALRGWTPSTDLSGTLRLTRTASILVGSYMKDGIWVQLASASIGTADAKIGLGAWSHNSYFADTEVQLAFDNFIINQGKLDCPITTIKMPMDGQVTVDFKSTSTQCTGNFGMEKPNPMLIYEDYVYQGGISVPITETFSVGEELLFYIKPGNFCTGNTYFSNDPNRAQITQIDEFTWRIGWEDWNDADFNDLIVEIHLSQSIKPFLELPYDYTNSTFINEVADYKLKENFGKVNSYFDHHYPTYAEDDIVVTYHGYLSGTDSLSFILNYDGHNGVDFTFSKFYNFNVTAMEKVDVLAAADGIVTSVITSTVDYGNHIVITHTNGLKTLYGHLSKTLVKKGDSVKQGDVIGKLGSTGRSTGHHIHFTVINADGKDIDPFGWMPFPNSTYYNKSDPWQELNNQLKPPKDSTSYYLWLHPLDRRVLNNANAETKITSQSGIFTATFAQGAYSEAYAIQVWDMLDQPDQVDMAMYPVAGVALFAFDKNESPFEQLNKPITIQFSLAEVGALTASRATNSLAEQFTAYQIYRFDQTSGQWLSLLTTFDETNGTINATTLNTGQFILAKQIYELYLPVVSR